MSSYTASTTCSLLIYLILARTGPGFKACNAPTQTNQTDGSRTHSRSIHSNWSETLLGYLSPAEKLKKRTIVRINIKSMNCFKNVLWSTSLSYYSPGSQTPPTQAPPALKVSWGTSSFLDLYYPPTHMWFKECSYYSHGCKKPTSSNWTLPFPSALVFEQNRRKSTQQQQNPTGAANITRASTVIRSTTALSTRQPWKLGHGNKGKE